MIDEKELARITYEFIASLNKGQADRFIKILEEFKSEAQTVQIAILSEDEVRAFNTNELAMIQYQKGVISVCDRLINLSDYENAKTKLQQINDPPDDSLAVECY